MNMYVSVYMYTVCVCARVVLTRRTYSIFFSHFIVYCSRSVYHSIIHGGKTTVDVVHGVPLWSNEDVRGALCAPAN